MDTKAIVDGVTDAVNKRIDLSKEEGVKALAAMQTTVESKYAEAEKLVKEIEVKFNDQVKEINEEMAKKGASLKEISEAIDNLKKKQGKLSAGGSPANGNERKAAEWIGEILQENATDILKYSGSKDFKMGTLEQKANITGSNFSTSGTLPSTISTFADFGPVTRAMRKVQIRDITPVINSATGNFVYYRNTSTQIGTGSFGFQAGQGNLKANLDYSLVQRVVPIDYLAGYARMARQMLADYSYMQTYVTTELVEDYRRSESAAFIPQLIAGSTAFTPGGSSVTAEFIVKAIADLLGKDWSPNGIVTDAPTWAKLMNTKPNDYGLPGGGSAVGITADGNVTFLGIPVLVQNNMPSGGIIVGDFTKAAIIQAEGLSVGLFEQDQDNVIRNLVTMRVEARVAFEVLMPPAFDYFTAGTT